MSLDATELLFEGFLQKRKDTMKMRWTTYWFRLHNTTLFFYTKKNADASHLRGYYYICTVQSVREVLRADRKRFMFEIIMTNGKRKMLAAETADLRNEWVGHLWRAMRLSSSAVSDSRSTHLEMLKQQEKSKHSTSVWDASPSMMDMLPAQPVSTPAPSDHIQSWIASAISLPQKMDTEESVYQDTEESVYQDIEKSVYQDIEESVYQDTEKSVYQNTQVPCGYQHQNGPWCQSPLLADASLNNAHWSSGLSTADNRQGDYDVLPLRHRICENNASAGMEDNLYDFPLSYRRAHEHPDPTESIYDTPSCLLRKISDNSIEEQDQGETYWTISGRV